MPGVYIAPSFGSRCAFDEVRVEVVEVTTVSVVRKHKFSRHFPYPPSGRTNLSRVHNTLDFSVDVNPDLEVGYCAPDYTVVSVSYTHLTLPTILRV